MLSREAARRRLGDGEDAGEEPSQTAAQEHLTPSDDAAVNHSTVTDAWSGLQISVAANSDAGILEALGPGGFIPQEFQLLREFGRLSLHQASDAPTVSSGPHLPTVIIHGATYFSGLPYQSPVTTLLKEFLPGSRAVAMNELLALQRLCGPLPKQKWQVAAADPSGVPPVVQLLGYMQAPQSDAAYELTGSDQESLFLVYKWQKMRPLSLLVAQPPPQRSQTGGGMLAAFFATGGAGSNSSDAILPSLAARRKMLRVVVRGVLEALAFCHERGVCHGSLGLGCVLLSSLDDRDADRLLVKLDNFGLSKVWAPPPGGDAGGAGSSAILGVEDSKAGVGMQRDLQAVALLLAEAAMAGCSGGSGAAALGGAALQRLLFDIYHEDVAQFREYCLQEEEYNGFVDFMDSDGGAGWDLLAALVRGTTPAALLLQNRFFKDAKARRASSGSGGGGIKPRGWRLFG